MADLTRQPAPDSRPENEGDDRERTVESLLVAGLDLYFAGDYERAIHAWTRVLFLDRSHARARAYIERARAVLAERQRETDELLHRGLAALDAGETDHARSLLASAIERGGAVEAAEVALERLVRLDVASRPGTVPQPDVSAGPPLSTPAAGQARRWVPPKLAITAGLLLVVAAAFALRWDLVADWAPDFRRETAITPTPTAEAPLPQPPVAILAMRRARALFTRGHLHEALTELAKIRADDPHRLEADRLEAEVQRALLDAAEITSSGSNTAAPPAGRR